jgi:hypothetical protein
MRPRVFALLLIAVVGAACSDSPTSPTTSTSTSTTVSFTTEPPFTGTLALSATSAKNFTVNLAGTVSITLASVLVAGIPVPTAALALGLGTWDGTTCTVTTSVTTTPALTAQLTATLTASAATAPTGGDRCVRITDVNNLGPLVFTIRIVHP